MNTSIQITHFIEKDWPLISAIYQEGIHTGIATFETKIPTWTQWNTSHIQSCRIKATINNTITGWAALSPISIRKVYRGVAEVSIYVTSKHRNSGIGKLLLSKLIEESENAGFWTLQANIFSNNKASIALHKHLGFREVGYREKIAQLDNNWYTNILLERRSKKVM